MAVCLSKEDHEDGPLQRESAQSASPSQTWARRVKSMFVQQLSVERYQWWTLGYMKHSLFLLTLSDHFLLSLSVDFNLLLVAK